MRTNRNRQLLERPVLATMFAIAIAACSAESGGGGTAGYGTTNVADHAAMGSTAGSGTTLVSAGGTSGTATSTGGTTTTTTGAGVQAGATGTVTGSAGSTGTGVMGGVGGVSGMNIAGAGTTGAAMGFASFTEAGEWFAMTCGLTGCHNNRYPPALTNTDLSVLQDTLATYVVERCGNLPLVVPGNPDGSALPMVVLGQCGELVMPFGCLEPATPEMDAGFGCVPQADVDRLRAWISGATPFQ